MAPEREPWTSEIEEIPRSVCLFCGFHIFSLLRFWSQFWDRLGPPFGHPFGPQAIRNRSPRRPWAGQEPIKISFCRPRTAPRAPQEASKSAPYAPGRPPWPYQAFLSAPRGFQETSRAHLAAMLASFWSYFGAISKRYCHQLHTPSWPNIARPGGMRVSD